MKATAAASASATRGQGASPSGALTQQKKATVTIEEIDAAKPSVTVRTADGHKVVALLEDKKNLEGLKVGDKVEITFTEALMVTVEPAKK
jgi:Cu/Ag efflux protein CusF